MTRDEIKKSFEKVLPGLKADFDERTLAYQKTHSLHQKAEKYRTQIKISTKKIELLSKKIDEKIVAGTIEDDDLKEIQQQISNEQALLSTTKDLLSRMDESGVAMKAEQQAKSANARLTQSFNRFMRQEGSPLRELEEKTVELIMQAIHSLEDGNSAIREFCLENDIESAGQYGIPKMELTSVLYPYKGQRLDSMRDFFEKVQIFINHVI